MNQRIQFCKNCTKCKFDNKIGIICGLTLKKPDFQYKCDKFEEDTENIQKHKERLEYNPKKWKRTDNKFTESSKSQMKFNLFELEPHTRDIEFRKSRYDKISITCISGYIFTMFYVLSGDEKFVENIKDPFNYLFWLVILIYPVIRYFIPFKKYRIDSKGIQVNKELLIKWKDIKSIHNYIQIDNEDNSITTFYLYIVLNTYKNIRISVDNYVLTDSINLRNHLKRAGIRVDSKELIESVILSFLKKYK